ncbi:MAG TPA: branched-chain amino acid ABC transporter permease [Acholeplasmatales bacterium]|nr:branched-chain amino acid ABC transporter permease [Acholeplasmatales bacterium]
MSFWVLFAIDIILLVLVYYFVNKFALKKQGNVVKKREKLINLLLVAFFVLFIVTMFLVVPPVDVVYSAIFSLEKICILALATTGIILIFRTSMTTNFAQGILATLGSYFASVILSNYLVDSGFPLWLVLTLAILAGALFSFVVGLLIDVIIIRNSKYPNPVSKQIITMGLVLAFTGLIPVVFTKPTEFYLLPPIATESLAINIFGYDKNIPMRIIYVTIITVAVLGTLFAALRYTKWGLGVRATASNEMVAGMMGVNTRIITALSWGIAGGLGALAAFFLAQQMTQLNPAFMINTQVNGFLASVLGSFNSFGGPIVGAIIIQMLLSLLPNVEGLQIWASVVVYSLILLIVLLKPLGLFGKKITKKV